MAILELEHVVKIYTPGFVPRKRTVLHDLSFTVGEGEVFGFLGPNGAGKTTTIKLLVGLLFPDRGSVRLRGLDTTDPRSRSRLGFLPENPYFYDYLTGAEFLDFYGRLYGLDAVTRRRRSGELLGRLGLEPAAGLALRRYSKGMLQRIGFAQALLAEPTLLILDEPMSGLDPIGRRLFRDLILAERARGTTLFFSSHILQDAEMICDRIAILDGGRLRRIGALGELLGEARGGGYEVALVGRVEEGLLGGAEVVTRAGERSLLRVASRAEAEALVGRARAAGLACESMMPVRATLEDLFLSQIQGAAGGKG